MPSSSAVEQVTVNHFVVGSIPTWAAIRLRASGPTLMAGHSTSRRTLNLRLSDIPGVECPEPVEGRFWVYILLCHDGSLYIGQSVNVRERLRKHRYKLGSKHTADHPVSKLVFVEPYNSLEDAVARERQLKNWSRAKKEALVTGDFATLKRLARSRKS